MHSQQSHSPILLRKIGGRFDAVRRGSSALFAPTAAGSGLGALSFLTSMPGLVLGALLMLAVVVAMVISWVHSPATMLGAEAAPTLGLAMMGTTEEVKKIRDDIMGAFETFKAKNDERLDQIAKSGKADPILSESVDKVNAKITELTAKLQEVEKLAARPKFEAALTEKQEARRDNVRAFLAAKREVDVDDVDPAEITAEVHAEMVAYEKGMKAYLRKGSVQGAMSVGSQPDGGYLVSPDRSGHIVEMVYEQSPIRAHADVQTTVSDTYSGALDLDEAGSGWVGESEQRDGDTKTPKIGEWSITVHELYAEPITTQKALDDSIRDPEGWLARKVSAKFARDEGAGSINGNGIKKMTGILTYANANKPTVAAWKRIQFLKTGVAGDWAAAT